MGSGLADFRAGLQLAPLEFDPIACLVKLCLRSPIVSKAVLRLRQDWGK